MRSFLFYFVMILSFSYSQANLCPAQTQHRPGQEKDQMTQSQPKVSAAQKEVLNTDARLLAAIWNADVPTRQKLADESLLYTSYSGETLNKEQWILSVEKILPGMASYQIENTHVLLEGKIAVVTGDLHIQFRENFENGKYREGSGRHRYLHVYEKKNGQWSLMIGQMTPIAKYLWKFRN